jgi:hypothetical protein
MLHWTSSTGLVMMKNKFTGVEDLCSRGSRAWDTVHRLRQYSELTSPTLKLRVTSTGSILPPLPGQSPSFKHLLRVQPQFWSCMPACRSLPSQLQRYPASPSTLEEIEIAYFTQSRLLRRRKRPYVRVLSWRFQATAV